MKTSHQFGKYRPHHNDRSYDKAKWNTDGHIDYSRTKDNKYLINENLEEVFEKLFKDPIEEFNNLPSQQKNPKRKTSVEEYYKAHKDDVREIILQVGKTSDADYNLTLDESDTILTQLLDDFKEHNPNFYVFGAYIHNDETSPHIHIDFLPLKHQERGMPLQISMEGAIQQQDDTIRRGAKKVENVTSQWIDKDWTYIEQCTTRHLAELGHDITITPHEWGIGAVHKMYWQHNLEEREKQLSVAYRQGLSNQQEFLKGVRENGDIERSTDRGYIQDGFDYLD